MRQAIALWIVVCALNCSGSQGQTSSVKKEQWRKDRLNAVASSYSRDNAFMGAVLVAEGDRILLDKGYGMASLEWGVKNSPDVRFRIGSISKQFTAALVLLLQQDGKLNIDHRVREYLPDAPASWEKITLAELLGQTSGIVNFTELPGFPEWSGYPHTPVELLALFRDKPLDFEPGDRFNYSNSGYVVLGEVIEKVSGKKYEQMLTERILKPLGLTNTGIDTDELALARRAGGYAPGERGLEVVSSGSLTVMWTEALYSTTEDLLKWEHALFEGRVISPALLDRMMMPGKGNYGFAEWINEREGQTIVDHGGSSAAIRRA